MTPPEKTQEERIEDAAMALYGDGKWRTWQDAGESVHDEYRACARRVLEAADAPPKPKWPSDETVETFEKAYYALVGYHLTPNKEALRECLREAMLSDPILKAAIEYGNAADRDRSTTGWRLRRAVNEAGL